MLRRALLPAFLAACALVSGVPAAASAAQPFSFLPGAKGFDGAITNRDGSPATQAGSHPYALTLSFASENTFGYVPEHPPGLTLEQEGEEELVAPVPSSSLHDASIDLPPGVVVNPAATPVRCTEAQLEETRARALGCPDESAVGVAIVSLDIGEMLAEARVPVYAMVPPPGRPAEFGFDVGGFGIVAHIEGRLRTGGDYGLSADVLHILAKLPVLGVRTTLWGNPSDPSHDVERGYCDTTPGRFQIVEEGGVCPTVRTGIPLLTMPSACSGPLAVGISADSWQEPGVFARDTFQTHDGGGNPVGVSGCSAQDFSPSLTVKPEPQVGAEAPTGLSVDLRLPQEQGVAGLAESDLKEAVVTLPAGMTVSPSAANGLGACTPAEIGLTTPEAPSCPDSSKLGTVRILTPLLAAPLQGSVYLAQQGNLAGNGSNPFGSLLALYLVAEGSGARVKIPGEVTLDPVSGQITARFGEDPATSASTGEPQFLPQLPFSELQMTFSGGPRAPLATPAACGAFQTTSSLAPWSGNAPATPADSFAISSGCGGSFAPALAAGTTNNRAGAFSPLSVTLSRSDGEQRLGGVQLTTPPGLLGVVANVPRCPEPEASQGTCGAQSQIGASTVASGPGEDPLWVRGGRVYLTGPYRGAPFGLSIVVPAVAGPFNLGNVVVRAAISIDPHTAQITITTDPLPTILQGVPLDVRVVNVTVDRPGFIFNPSSCSPMSIGGTIVAVGGASATVTNRFQAADCPSLPFAPTLSALTLARTTKAGGAYLHVRVTSGPGQANIARVKVDLPKQLPSRLTTLHNACRDTVFDADPAACPAASIVGSARAVTPLLASALTGPAYLVSHAAAAFPDLVFVLQGEGITLDLVGNTEISHGITSETFAAVPDAPISSFDATFPQGPDSILAAYGSLCAKPLTMPTAITAQNGALVRPASRVSVSGCAKPKPRPRRPAGRAGRARRSSTTNRRK
jgi:hypothetical protein